MENLQICIPTIELIYISMFLTSPHYYPVIKLKFGYKSNNFSRHADSKCSIWIWQLMWERAEPEYKDMLERGTKLAWSRGWKACER